MDVTTMLETIDTRVMSRYQMVDYVAELTREKHEELLQAFAEAERPRPSEETLQLIVQAEGMGYTYDIVTGHFVMERPETHDFLFWLRLSTVGTVESATGTIEWNQR